MNKIVVIGAVAAGSKAAAKLKRLKPEYDIEIYTEEKFISYSACGLPYYIEGIIPSYENLIVRTPEDFEKQGIKVFLQHKATRIMPLQKKIIVQDLSTNEEKIISYEKLLLATGARPFLPPIKNIDAKNIYTLRTLDDGIKIKEQMKYSKTVTVVGGGYIGIELLEAFVKNGLKIKIVTNANYLMSSFDEDMSKLIQQEIQNTAKDQVEIYTNDTVVEFEIENGFAKKTITQSGQILTNDFIIICTGVVPNTDLAESAGLKLGVKNAFAVNEKMQTTDESIYAAGDCCEKICALSQVKCYVALGSIANKEGRVAAISIAGGDETFPGILTSVITKFFKYTITMTGLTETEAKNRGFEVISTIVTKKDRAGYMPDVKDVTLKLVVNKENHTILGAQAIGYGDADKRISIVSGLITANVKIDSLINMDFSYAPPYSTAISTLNLAATKIAEKLK